MAKNYGIKGMTEEELRLFRQKQMYDAIRAKQMSDEEYGKVYQQNIFQAHPEAEPRGFWGNLGNAVTGGIIDDYHASKWADEQIDIQEASRKWSSGLQECYHFPKKRIQGQH